jgi:deoxyhypusine synthase
MRISKSNAQEFMKKTDFLKTPVEHIDIKYCNASEIICAVKKMFFAARDLAVSSEIYDRMLTDGDCAVLEAEGSDLRA